jgi:long-chain-fatty-acid--CoA ligase ACSBG
MVGSETRLGADGEICYRGRHVFMGYMYMEAQTQETIDADGFLHSGDVGVFDEDADPRIRAGPGGFMTITGRKKELLITAGGENVPPVLIETEMKQAMPALSNVMVIGDRRKYLSMLLTFKTAVDPATGAPTSQLAADALYEGRRIGSSAETVEQAVQDPLWKKYLDDGMRAGNSKTTSSAQVVQKWAVLPRDFSEAEGTLTPTLKLKRSVAAERYAGIIEQMYT